MEQQPLLVIRPANRWNFLDFRELLHYSDLLNTFAMRDVKLRYRQTALGAIWVVLQPLLGAGIFQIIFGLIAQTPTDGLPSFLFYFAGFTAYKSFDNTLNKASTCMVRNANMVSKIYFPRVILPLSTIHGTLVDFGVSCLVLAVLLLLFRVPPPIWIVTMPFWLLLIQMLAVGLGLFFAALTVRYRDVQYIIPVFVQLGMFLSPIAFSVSYAMEQMETKLLDAGMAALAPVLKNLVLCIPLTGLLDAFRWSVLGTAVFNWGAVGLAVVVSVLVFLGGALSFSQMEQDFADVI
ncbi:MAG: ABC transporter permease [Armatimonadaceae bacterium]